MLALPDTRPELAGTPWRWLPLGRAPRVFALIDAHREAFATQWAWNAGWWTNTPHKLYAKRNVGAARSTIYLHREILTLADPRDAAFRAAHQGDHINGQSLDARDANLRWLTPMANTLHRIPWDDVPTVEEIARELLAGWQSQVWKQELAAVPF